MFTLSLRAARPQLARMAAGQTARRALSTSMVQRDVVRDMYLRELRSYKPAPLKANDSEGHVLKFAVPATPASPEEADLASQITAYESQVVEVEGQTASAGSDGVALEQDWFEEPEEEEAAAH